MADEKSFLEIQLDDVSDRTRRLKVLRVSPETLAMMVLCDGMIFQIHSEIPKNAQLVRVWMDGYHIGEISLVFYHESFEIVPEGKMIPDFEPSTVLFER